METSNAIPQKNNHLIIFAKVGETEQNNTNKETDPEQS